MNTTYDEVITVFLGKITEFDWFRYTDTEKDEIIEGYMIAACSKFRTSQMDLSDRNKETRVFNNVLGDERIDIITTGMIVEWLKPHLYDSENLKSFLNTKDYNRTSPQGLLSQVRQTYNEARIEFKNMITNYSFNHNDVNEVVF